MTPRQAALRRFLEVSWPDRFLLAEAVAWLGFARLAIAALPFRRIAQLAARSVRHVREGQDLRIAAVRRIGWAITVTAHRLPWRAQCFEQGLAAQFMLRRRGIASILHYGVAPDKEKGLTAHVWVRDGEVNVVGGEAASRYASLASFPPENENS